MFGKKILLVVVMLMCVKTAYGAALPKENRIEKAGDWLQILISTTAYTATVVLNDEEGKSQFYHSFIENLAVTYLLKLSINKPRPANHGGFGFPSGHTSTSFHGAAFIHQRFGLKYGIPAYLCAAYVGWSRVGGGTKKHDYNDVVAGATIGILSSYFFTMPRKSVGVTPRLFLQSYGMGVHFNW